MELLKAVRSSPIATPSELPGTNREMLPVTLMEPVKANPIVQLPASGVPPIVCRYIATWGLSTYMEHSLDYTGKSYATVDKSTFCQNNIVHMHLIHNIMNNSCSNHSFMHIKSIYRMPHLIEHKQEH